MELFLGLLVELRPPPLGPGPPDLCPAPPPRQLPSLSMPRCPAAISHHHRPVTQPSRSVSTSPQRAIGVVMVATGLLHPTHTAGRLLLHPDPSDTPTSVPSAAGFLRGRYTRTAHPAAPTWLASTRSPDPESKTLQWDFFGDVAMVTDRATRPHDSVGVAVIWVFIDETSWWRRGDGGDASGSSIIKNVSQRTLEDAS